MGATTGLSYHNVNAGGTRRPAREEEIMGQCNGGNARMSSRSTGFDPSAAFLRESSQRGPTTTTASARAGETKFVTSAATHLEPPLPIPARNAKFQGTIHLQPPVVNSSRLPPSHRREEVVEEGFLPKRERDLKSKRVRSVRKNAPVKTTTSSSSRRNQLPSL